MIEAPVPALAAGVAIAAWIAAATGRRFITRAGRGDRIAKLISRSGILSGLREPSLDEYRRVIGGLVYWGTLCAGAAVTLSMVSETAAERLRFWFSTWVSDGLIALAVLAGARWTARYGGRAVLIAAVNAGFPHASRWAAAVRGGTMFAGVALASELTGIGIGLIRPAFLIVLAGVTGCLAVALIPAVRDSLHPRVGGTAGDSGEASQ